MAGLREDERLSGWGLLGVPGRELRSEDLERLSAGAVLMRGLGRSYGDASLPAPSHPLVAGSALADRLLAFDPASGRLRAEAGLSLRTLNRLLLPRGFYAPVTPGTQIITLGGMVAADVHGKNHHVAGTFGRHVRALRLRGADGRVRELSRTQEPELFRATLGGMGLTGHVLEVDFELERVPSPWVQVESERIADIERFLVALKDAARAWPHTMGWIDCLSGGRALGRGILFRGRWATADEAPGALPAPPRRPAVPCLFPSFVVDRWSVRLFNAVYYGWHGAGTRRGLQHPETFFYPLDAVGHWNRMYGARGFTQYQCVLPDERGPGAVRRFLELSSARGGASMLCVIKDCGAEGEGLLSFPRPGTSIALDIPVRAGTQALVDALNELVIAEGGRVYLAKDQFTRPEHYRAMEPRLPAWQRVRRLHDPDGRIKSALSVRILGDKP
jgi:FAD/FMN-containing dehydrogenase